MAEEAKKVMLIEDDRFLSSLIKARLEKDGLVVVQSFGHVPTSPRRNDLDRA